MSEAVFIEDFSSEVRAAEALCERRGLSVFVGRRSRRGSTDVMAGTKADGYFRAIHCVGGDHLARATGYVEAYRKARSA